jgi:hypothetical protein
MKFFLFYILITIIKASSSGNGEPRTPNISGAAQKESPRDESIQPVTSSTTGGSTTQTPNLPTRSTTAVSGSLQATPVTVQAPKQQHNSATLDQTLDPQVVVSPQEGSTGVKTTQPATSSTTSGPTTQTSQTKTVRNEGVNVNPATKTSTVQSRQPALTSATQGRTTEVKSHLIPSRPEKEQQKTTHTSVASNQQPAAGNETTAQGSAGTEQSLHTAQHLASSQTSNNSQMSGQTREGSSSVLSPSTPQPLDQQELGNNLDILQHDQSLSSQDHRPSTNSPSAASRRPRPTDKSSSQRPATREAVTQEKKQLPVSGKKEVTKAVKTSKSKKTKSPKEKAKKSKSKRGTKSKSDKENVESDVKKKSKSKSSDKKKKSGKSKKSKSKGTEKKPKSVKPKKTTT